MADLEGVVSVNSEGNEEFLHYPDVPVEKAAPVESPGQLKKLVPALPPLAEEGEVVRTAGPSAQATLEANVGVGGESYGVPDGALGHHAIDENEPVSTSFTRHQAELAAAAEPAPKASTSKAKASA